MSPKFLFTLAFAIVVSQSQAKLQTPGVHCVSDVAFTIIAEVFNNQVDIGVRLYCPQGHHCVSNSESPCHPNSVPSPIALPLQSATAENASSMPFLYSEILCRGPGYYPAKKCNEYYECAPMYKWFKAVLGTCRDGYYFSEQHRPCSMPPNVVCTD